MSCPHNLDYYNSCHLLSLLKAVVKRKNPHTPAFQPFIKLVSHFLQKQLHAVQCLYQLGAAIGPQTPLLAARADKAGEEGDCSNRQSGAPQGACGTSKGSSAEVFMLEHALCRSNSSSEKSALAATPQIGGNPALDL